MDTQKLDQTYIANTYARFPVTIVKGKGSLVWDDTGKEYIDLSTGIAVDIFGAVGATTVTLATPDAVRPSAGWRMWWSAGFTADARS